MREPEVALVFSPESWVEGVHRHLTDHGGARIRHMVMDPSLALEEEYETLIVSHRWPALTPAFVHAAHARGRRLLGVYDRAEPAGRDHLVSLGTDRVIESDAPMTEFLEALVALTPDELRGAVSDTELRRFVEGPPSTPSDPERGRIIAIGGAQGAGVTEIGIGVAASASSAITLVDADDMAPAVAQRLGLPIEPNLRTAVDAVEYGIGDISSTLVPAPRSAFRVLCGLPNVAAWSQLRPGEVVDVVEALSAITPAVLANVGSQLEELAVGVGRTRHGITRAVLERADAVIGVGRGTPVGVTRLLAWVAEARLISDASLHLVVNQSPSDGFRRAEIADEIERTYPPTTLTFVPHDARVEAAAWSGDLVAAGPFMRSVAELAFLVGASSGARNGARRATRPRLPVR